MLFNSFEFIFIFLPVVFIIYFVLNRKKYLLAAKVWLVVSSLFFYAWWNINFLPIICLSILVNYSIGNILSTKKYTTNQKWILTVGIFLNVLLLGFFKYVDFFIVNLNALFDGEIPLFHLALPLAISFFTFQQIGYLVDAYHGEVKERDFLNYTLFVSFFPQLIAGPIVLHKKIMPQFADRRNKFFNSKNISVGIFVFSIGLFKKVILADTFAIWATQGFDQLHSLSFIEAWIVSLSYTFQLYFDFSGYMDMATGAALLFNIKLPVNFNSPYKALNIQDTWSRWHMTLGQFLYRYIYFPVNRFLLRKVFTPLHIKKYTMLRSNIALMILFLISGIWHGAGWTFVFWGFLHGAATIIHRHWKSAGFKMNKYIAWFITFNFINASLVFFRANNFPEAMKVLKGMSGWNGITFPERFSFIIPDIYSDVISIGETQLIDDVRGIQYIIVGLLIILLFENSEQLREKFKPTWYTALFTIIIFMYALLSLTKESIFLYFNF
ncbi:MBOAT family O-acyltransferase [Psychrobacillus sp.]|uniref:MBOAT family O-acyltransferase n=1 Tax=Psychrobacillus sp. TaxID=1871623 RepID=UPI0028BE0A6A|nr:MBOAT family O-acyltransferase [Psychrobacillus sp.]